MNWLMTLPVKEKTSCWNWNDKVIGWVTFGTVSLVDEKYNCEDRLMQWLINEMTGWGID